GIITLAMVLGIITLICFSIGLTILILNNFRLLQTTWSNYLAIGFTTLAAVFAALGMFVSTSRRFLRWVFSLIHPEVNLSPASPTPHHKNISSFPPPTDPTAILQRNRAARQIYETLI